VVPIIILLAGRSNRFHQFMQHQRIGLAGGSLAKRESKRL
jgi:hypothetical protein